MATNTIKHLGIDYSLGHLKAKQHVLSWVGKNQQTLNIAVRIRYSSHCYSDKSLPEEIDVGIIHDRLERRVFCPIRYQHSLALPSMFRALIERPVETVYLTYEDNCSIYRLEMPHSLMDGEIYYAFFRVRKASNLPQQLDLHRLDLFVESAYPRKTRVAVKARMPFGRVVERLVM